MQTTHTRIFYGPQKFRLAVNATDAMTLNDFYRRQLERWKLATDNYKALFGVETRRISPSAADGVMEFTLQYNPARVRSTGANVDKAAIEARPCFLCAVNRPETQMVLDPWELASPSRSDVAKLTDEYEILLNPFPIFPCHFTVPARRHTPQLISADRCCRFGDMLILSKLMEGMALFYNGARCGASAPDHFHFQAVPVGAVALLTTIRPLPFLTFGYESSDIEEMTEWFRRAVAEAGSLPAPSDYCDSEKEPRMNVWCTYAGGVWRVVVIPRRLHRPDFYGIGDGRFMVSPASIDLAGTVVLPSKNDFDNFSPETLATLLDQTTYPNPSLL